LLLSSGEHKRFQLIKAFLSKAQVIILDNPFLGLDAATRNQLNKLINKAAAQGTKFILITNEHQIPECITHILLLHKGKQKNFTPKSLFHFKNLPSDHSFQLDKMPAATTFPAFNTAVKMVNVSVEYGNKKILHNINWQINKGERWLLKGANGAGKSTLLSLILGDNPKAYANEIYLFDKRRGTGETIWEIKKNIGYVSPELHWYFNNTISCADTIASGFFDTIGVFRPLTAAQQKQRGTMASASQLIRCSK